MTTLVLGNYPKIWLPYATVLQESYSNEGSSNMESWIFGGQDDRIEIKRNIIIVSAVYRFFYMNYNLLNPDFKKVF